MSEIENILNILAIKGYETKELSKIDGGINSNTFLIGDNLKKYILKIYNDNKIERIKREKSFFNFLSQSNIKNVPNLLDFSDKKNWLLMSWIKGEKVHEVNFSLCEELVKFFIEIQKFRNTPSAIDLPPASDAVYSLNDHILSINNRGFKFFSKNDELIDSYQYFFPKLNKLISQNLEDIINLTNNFKDKNLDFEYTLPIQNRIISQSDVGFHNIICKNNDIYFIDFEYAGWDDPGKLFCDLLMQPDHNIPTKYMQSLDLFFQDYILKVNYDKDRLILLLELTRIKWSLIILNPLLNFKILPKQILNKFAEKHILKSSKYLEESINIINYVKKIYYARFN